MRKIILFIVVAFLLFQTTILADDEEGEVFGINEVWEEINEASTTESKEPKLNSRAGIVIDRNTKAILFGKNENEKRAMASTTKIMTAIIVLEKGNLSDTIEVGAKAAGIGGSRLGLKKGDKITLNDLLYGLMLRSRK